MQWQKWTRVIKRDIKIDMLVPFNMFKITLSSLNTVYQFKCSNEASFKYSQRTINQLRCHTLKITLCLAMSVFLASRHKYVRLANVVALPSVSASVAWTENLTLAITTKPDRAFILHLCIFVTRPLTWDHNFLPWPWSLTYFWKTLTLAITFKPEDVRLSYCKCVFLVTRPFTWYHNYWPCDLDLEVCPTFDKNFDLGLNFQTRSDRALPTAEPLVDWHSYGILMWKFLHGLTKEIYNCKYYSLCRSFYFYTQIKIIQVHMKDNFVCRQRKKECWWNTELGRLRW